MSDYERYLRTDELLALQKAPGEMAHRDELLFQTVHQSSELWLKHIVFESESAARWIGEGDLAGAARLLRRAGLGLRFLIDHIEMLEHMSPWDYRLIRRVLAEGSGFDSPGFIAIQAVAKQLGQAFHGLLAQRRLSLVDLYRNPGPHEDLYSIAELLTDWDARLALWRQRHLAMVERIIGSEATGTQGHPVSLLRDLASRRCFPALWEARNELTRLARQEAGAAPEAEAPQ